MRRAIRFALVAGSLVALGAADVSAEETRYGAGIFFDRSVPTQGLGDRYAASQKFGLVFDYKLSSRATLEFEYHHAGMDKGKIETASFTWGVDGERYASPEAKSSFNLNSFLMNALVRLGEEPEGEGLELIPYVAVGAGFYDYQDEISGLIYPGQRFEPLDADLLIDPRRDDHTSIGANLGLGMSVMQGGYGLDLRARYHLIMGDLRSMDAWGLESVFPMGLVDVRTAFKLYF
jgi:hypothetical protein